MFKFLMKRKRRYVLYYTMYPGTFVLKTTIEAQSPDEANRIFDKEMPPEARRLPGLIQQIF